MNNPNFRSLGIKKIINYTKIEIKKTHSISFTALSSGFLHETFEESLKKEIISEYFILENPKNQILQGRKPKKSILIE